MKSRRLLVGLVAIFATMGMAASCTPPDAGGALPSTNWSFKGTSVKVVKSQDKSPIDFLCINCKDEPYLLNIAFRAKIGVPGSAQAWVVNNRTSAPENVSEGTTVNVTDAGSPAVFSGVQPVDVLDLANTNNHLEIVGTYTWASEEDQIGLGVAADGIAGVLKDALNSTVASADLNSLDANFIISLILDNIGGALGILAQNFPIGFPGIGDLNDDVLGGAIYIGIGARGTLGDALEAVIGSTPFPVIDIPLLNIPPSIAGGGLYLMNNSKTFNQSFSGAGGIHDWTMKSGPA